jgi:phosphate transport system protein
LPRIETPLRLGEMADKAQQMLRQVLDAFVNLDTATAHAICAADSEVDELNFVISTQAREMMVRNPAQIEPLLQILHIARHLERIADHATNIAEDLIYLVEGKIVRHKTEAALARQASRSSAS